MEFRQNSITIYGAFEYITFLNGGRGNVGVEVTVLLMPLFRRYSIQWLWSIIVIEIYCLAKDIVLCVSSQFDYEAGRFKGNWTIENRYQTIAKNKLLFISSPFFFLWRNSCSKTRNCHKMILRHATAFSKSFNWYYIPSAPPFFPVVESY